MSEIQQQALPGKWKTFKDRLFSTVLLLVILGGAVVWNDAWGYRALVCVFCALTAWEWGSMLRRSGKPSQPWLGVFMGILYPLALTRAISCDRSLVGVFAMAVAFPVLLTIVSFTWEMRKEVVGSNPLKSVATTLLAFIYPGWMFAFILFAMFDDTRYINVILWLVIVTKLSDLFAYVSGMLLGGKIWKGNKLIPHISPKKTWEGLIGSLILTTFSGYLMASLLLEETFQFMFPTWALVPITVIIFFLAVVGDLAGSLIKRSLDIKDSGSLLPGIGGFFDLVDSLAFTIPGAFVLFMGVHFLGLFSF